MIPGVDEKTCEVVRAGGAAGGGFWSPALWVGLLALSLLAGCASPARRLEPAVVEALALGTPKSEIDRTLGRAGRISTGPGGRTVAIYSWSFESGGLTQTRHMNRFLSLRYNQNFHLEKKLLHEGEMKYQVNFFSPDIIGKPMKLEDILQKIHVGDTRKQLLEVFGAPSLEVLRPEGGSLMSWIAARQRVALSVFRQYDAQVFDVVLDDDGVVKDFKVNGSFDPTDRDLKIAPK